MASIGKGDEISSYPFSLKADLGKNCIGGVVLVLMDAHGPLLYSLAGRSHSMRCFGAMLLILGLMSLGVMGAWAQDRGFTQDDRDRLIRLEATLQVFMQQVDKRFEAVEKRFEVVDKRFEELREDMNKRFEQIDKRFEQLTAFLWMLVAIFTSLTAVVIGFAYWDRRTTIRKAKEEAVEAIEKEGRVQDLVHALRRLSMEDQKLAEVLRSFRLF